MSAKITPPWSPGQVEALNLYQRRSPMHPFTCPDRDDGNHAVLDGEFDFGILVATPSGWICPDCDYRQEWAHNWMAESDWWSL